MFHNTVHNGQVTYNANCEQHPICYNDSPIPFHKELHKTVIIMRTLFTQRAVLVEFPAVQALVSRTTTDQSRSIFINQDHYSYIKTYLHESRPIFTNQC